MISMLAVVVESLARVSWVTLIFGRGLAILTAKANYFYLYRQAMAFRCPKPQLSSMQTTACACKSHSSGFRYCASADDSKPSQSTAGICFAD